MSTLIKAKLKNSDGQKLFFLQKSKYKDLHFANMSINNSNKLKNNNGLTEERTDRPTLILEKSYF